jgi:hypothetical protein
MWLGMRYLALNPFVWILGSLRKLHGKLSVPTYLPASYDFGYLAAGEDGADSELVKSFCAIRVIPDGIAMHQIAEEVSFPMNRFLLISLLATTAAWILIRTGRSSARIVPVKEAAAKLQEAWADHHTTA